MTKQQRRQLEWFRKYREHSPTIVGGLAGEWRLLVGYALMFGLCLVMSLLLRSSTIVAVGFYVILGAFSTFVGQVGARRRVWPVVREVIHWEEIDRILAEDRDN